MEALSFWSRIRPCNQEDDQIREALEGVQATGAGRMSVYGRE